MIRVLRAGMLTTIQDQGRPGLAHLGVPPSGAADWPSLAFANRLVGNDERAAGLETTLDGCALETTDPCWVAVTGARAPLTAAGRPAAPDHATFLPAGATLEIGTATSGLRSYVAFSGGLKVPPVLGSASCDLLSGLGPPPLRASQELALGRPAGHPVAADCAPGPAPDPSPTLRLLPGPRAEWFAPSVWPTLTAQPYRVEPASNRVGLRLRGPVLHWATERELPSEGMVAGALQVPPAGQPILFLTDHPTTGGYPVIGCIEPADVAVAAQLRPGDRVWFRLVCLERPGPAELAARLAVALS